MGKKALFLFVITVLLAGCVSNEKYSYFSKDLNDTNSGILVGSSLGGSAITIASASKGNIVVTYGTDNQHPKIKTVSTENIQCGFADNFIFRLPAGEYIVSQIGADWYATQTLKFSIIPGKIFYIGSLFGERSSSKLGGHLTPEDQDKIKVMGIYNFGTKGFLAIDKDITILKDSQRVFFVDNLEEDLKKVLKAYPNISIDKSKIINLLEPGESEFITIVDSRKL